jgi:hypothetical protein
VSIVIVLCWGSIVLRILGCVQVECRMGGLRRCMMCLCRILCRVSFLGRLSQFVKMVLGGLSVVGFLCVHMVGFFGSDCWSWIVHVGVGRILVWVLCQSLLLAFRVGVGLVVLLRRSVARLLVLLPFVEWL